MRSLIIYAYDPQLRPGVIGVDFESDNKNETYTLRYEHDEAEKLGRDVMEWMKSPL